MVLRHSLITATVLFLMGVAWMALEKLLGTYNQTFIASFFMNLLVSIPTIWIYHWGAKRFRLRQPQQQVSFSQSLGFGLLTTLLVMAFYPGNLWIFEHIINPHYYDMLIQHTVKTREHIEIIAHELKISPSQITDAQLLEYAKNNINHTSQLNSGLLGYGTMGTVVSVVVAIFSSKK